MNDSRVRTNTIMAGLYNVAFIYNTSTLNIQEAVFASNGLEMVSPAQLGFLRANNHPAFNRNSTTNADVFYDDRDNAKIVVVKGGNISKEIGLDNLVKSWGIGKECFIPKSKTSYVYDMVDTMLREGTAFVVPYRTIRLNTDSFEENELTEKLFTDKILGIKAQDYGDWLESQGKMIQSLYFDSEKFHKSQKYPYLKKLYITGEQNGTYELHKRGFLPNPNQNFEVIARNNNYYYADAFGVRFEKA